MDTPRPMSPDCGTQNIDCSRVEPQSLSFLAGPGTLVITAVVLRPNRLSSASCAGRTNMPATDNMPNASSGWVLPLRLFMRLRTSNTRSIGFCSPIGSTSGARPKRLPSL